MRRRYLWGSIDRRRYRPHQVDCSMVFVCYAGTMSAGTIKISASTDAIDASIISKDEAVLRFARTSKLSMRDIAAIGDGTNDLPFLELDDLLLVGCPANAQTRVKRIVDRRANGFISASPYLDGFMEFYERAAALGAKAVISDRDGVLLSPSGRLDDTRIGALLSKIDPANRPMLKILTGSSYEQNIAILANSVITNIASRNPALRQDPFLVLAENGSIAINVITLEQRLDIDTTLLKRALQVLLSRFRPVLLKELSERVLRQFGLHFTSDPDNQTNTVYLPKKATMVTVDVPRTCRGEMNFRTSAKSEHFRDAVVDAMKRSADASGLLVQLI